MQLKVNLTSGIASLGLQLSEQQHDLLFNYLELMHKWNKHYNLTSIRTVQEMIAVHLLDSLAVLPYLHGNRVLDVGSGAGLPGIPLAIAHSERQFTLLDSNNKKTRFLLQAKMSLGLGNIEIVTARIEEYHPVMGFDTVISRAFTDLAEMVAKVRHSVAKDGKILAMKGRFPHTELSTLPESVIVESVNRLHIPDLDAERHLVCITL